MDPTAYGAWGGLVVDVVLELELEVGVEVAVEVGVEGEKCCFTAKTVRTTSNATRTATTLCRRRTLTRRPCLGDDIGDSVAAPPREETGTA